MARIEINLFGVVYRGKHDDSIYYFIYGKIVGLYIETL